MKISELSYTITSISKEVSEHAVIEHKKGRLACINIKKVSDHVVIKHKKVGLHVLI